MEQTVFELDLLEEARDFLKSLTKEIRGKIGYNIRRVQKGKLIIDCSPFGIRISIR